MPTLFTLLSVCPFQAPFSKSIGQPQAAVFHPRKPLLYVANQRTVRVYSLTKQALEQKLEAGVKWISGLDIHPGGDHVILSSYDYRTVWFDSELSSRPYKTLKYHAKAVRRAVFHPGGYPLMATASDDGTVHVFHARVFNDFAQVRGVSGALPSGIWCSTLSFPLPFPEPRDRPGQNSERSQCNAWR